MGLSVYSTRVSNELGAGKPEAARTAVYVVLCMTVSESIVMGLILILIRNAWGYAYSSEMEVVTYLASMMPLLALTNFVDGLTCVLSGNTLTLLPKVYFFKPGKQATACSGIYL